MDFTAADLKLISSALGSWIDVLQIRLHLGEKDALRETRAVQALAGRVEAEIRETSLPVGGDRYTVDADGMTWA